MSKINHIHRLKRHTYKTTGNSIFFCTLPDCHFKLDTKLALGKYTSCSKCGKTTIINERNIRMANPNCDSCVRRKDSHAKEIKTVTRTIIHDTVQDLQSRLSQVVGQIEDDDKKDEL